MKTSKSALKSSSQEGCGVWLDAAQLKRKAKHKRITRPISKMLNPFLGGGGYSLAVALNFTQTKIEMPKTKQSSISTFFTPKHREVPNKMSTSEVPIVDPVLPSSTSTTCASTAPTPVASGTKQRREIDLDFYDSELGVAHEGKSENVPEEVWHEQEASPTHSQNTHCEFEEEQFEEINPPQSKRRLTKTSSLPDDSQPPPQTWSQEPLFTYSQYSDGEFCLSNLKNIPAKDFSDSEPSCFNSLQSKRDFCDRMAVEAKTSTQKSSKHSHSSQVDNDKDNSRFFSSQSPRRHSTLSHIEPLSNHKWTEPKSASPLKHIPVHLRKKSAKENSLNSQSKWTKPSSSPLKKTHPSCRAVDEDSLAMLFTQDSEGFRVIAHRDLQARSPLKDQSNINIGTVRTTAYKSLVEVDEEDEPLFTQDSQGNLVIRH